MKKVWKVFLSLSMLLFIISACSMNKEENTADTDTDIEQSEKIQVVTSIFPVYEITKEVAGDQAEVSLMVGENEDAHHYEPSAQAVSLVNNADVFLYTSDVMEFWADSLLAVVENEDLRTIELAEGLDLSLSDTGEDLDVDEEHTHEDDEHAHEDENHDHDHDHGGLDPHFWVDPVTVKEQLPVIVENLSAVDPEGADVYEENAEKFAKELDELDMAFTDAFEDAENRVFVVQHQAFGHLAARYDLEQVSMSGLTTEVEPNPQTLVQIADFINEQHVPIVYYQSGASTATAEAIARETDTEIAVLYDLENKPEDLNEDENIYFEAMYHNLEELKKTIN